MSDATGPSPTLFLREVVRFTEQGQEDRLTFQPGVNVLVGVPNTGKSKWLRVIDYLFGDDSKPEDALGEDIATKFSSARASLAIGDVEWIVERKWREPGLATKICLNDEWLTLHEFTMRLMDALHIPVLHYPQGNPYGSRTWPELGWRSLYRHVFRRQSFWTDLADRQPESEQHACLLQFLGIAEVLFSKEYGQMVALQKKVQQLQNTREQFVAMLQEVSHELVDEKELGVAMTPDSIAAAIQRQKSEITAIQARRQAALRALLDRAAGGEEDGGAKEPRKDIVERLGQELATLRAKEEACTLSLRKTEDRLVELRSHRNLVADELGRMERAVAAGALLADLKITHCPACDRQLDRPFGQADRCFLCQRPTDASGQSAAVANRLLFEVEQLKAELSETEQLISVMAGEASRLGEERALAGDAILRVDERLQPVRSAAAFVLPPEIAIFDQDTGRLAERVAQLKRIQDTLARRETIAVEVDRIQGEVASLEAELAKQSKSVSFDRAGDLLSDGINTYLNLINEIKPKSWTQKPADFILRDRDFVIRIGQSNWHSKLGGTLTLLFLIAYHYALMSLAGKSDCHFPGLCILDFPAQLDGVAVSDAESFVLEPFVRMVQQPNQPLRQVIAAGSLFAGVHGANRIQLTTVWV